MGDDGRAWPLNGRDTEGPAQMTLTPNRIQSRGFAQPPERVRLRDIEREPQRLVRQVSFTGTTTAAVPKENAIYSEPYRRLVASLPCAHCRIEGYSQAAHPPPTAKSRKEDDRLTFPLCATRPGIVGCHVEFDQMRLFPRPAMRYEAERWGRQTRAAIRAAGMWPPNLPTWAEESK